MSEDNSPRPIFQIYKIAEIIDRNESQYDTQHISSSLGALPFLGDGDRNAIRKIIKQVYHREQEILLKRLSVQVDKAIQEIR